MRRNQTPKTGHLLRSTSNQIAAYLDLGGIARIVDDPLPVVLAGQRVRINHFPYLMDTRYDMKFMQHRPEDDGSWLLHVWVPETRPWSLTCCDAGRC